MLEKAQTAHLANVKAFRCLQGRLAKLAEDGSCLFIALDGLDQSKTRWPRNMQSAKALENLWRPQVHLIGFICFGVSWIG